MHDSSEATSNEEAIDRLLDLHTLYTDAQIELEGVSHNRTSIITLTQGLLFVGYNGLSAQTKTEVGSLAISVLGFVLAVLWMAFEQRSHIFFRGRSTLLRSIEAQITELLGTKSSTFRGLWTEVPLWVTNSAKWYERYSAQAVLRVWIPLMFAVVWVALVALSLEEVFAWELLPEPKGGTTHSATTTTEP